MVKREGEGEEKGRLIPSEVIGTGRDNEIKFRAGLYIGRVESRQDFLILDFCTSQNKELKAI